MSTPRLSLSERREVAQRYQDGESMPQLAEAYSVSVGVIDRALRKERVQTRSCREAQALVADELRPCRECGRGVHPNAVKPLCPMHAKLFCQRCDGKLPADWRTRLCPPCKFAHRYRNRPLRLCRICGRMGARGTKRNLCAVHVKCFCSVCDQGKPAARVNHRCTQCEQDRKLILWAKKGRRCSQCGEGEAVRHTTRCGKCLHEEYEVRRWAVMHLERPCVKCGETLPKGRQYPRCVTCQRQRERERRRNLVALGAHRCAMCKEELPLSRQTYCGGCGGMLAKWRAAWHQNNPIARQLGTVRTTRRWQEKSASQTQSDHCEQA